MNLDDSLLRDLILIFPFALIQN